MSTSKPAKPAKPAPPKAPKPTALAGKKRHPVKVPVVTEISDAEMAKAAKFGKVDEGKVFVTVGDESHELGPAKGDEPLIAYARKYFDHVAALERFKARLEGSDLSVRDIDSSLKALRSAIDSPDSVGDLADLQKRLEPVEKEATEVRSRIAAEREAARTEATAAREALVAAAEKIAEKSDQQIHWKNDTTALRSLLDEWKEAQKSGTRIAKDVEKDLWKRFAHARSSFEKRRKHHFAELDRNNSVVADRKEELVKKAEQLRESTDWDRTARAFRDLMTEWKSAGRGRRTVDDSLWERFKAAQDGFFDAKRNATAAEEEALSGNVAAKEEAVAAAESLLPIKDLEKSKPALRAALDRFEAAGQVPRGDAARLNKRIGAVERALREAEEKAWESSNPELEARLSGATAQLEEALAKLDKKIAAAEKAGDTAKVDSLTSERTARAAWLEQIRDAG